MHLSLGGVAVDNAGAATGDAGVFTALTGPSKLPSSYVSTQNMPCCLISHLTVV